jgi:hypothetical protein
MPEMQTWQAFPALGVEIVPHRFSPGTPQRQGGTIIF